MTRCHAYVCLHLCFGLCDRAERKLRLTQMLTRVRRAARRSRRQARRLRVCVRSAARHFNEVRLLYEREIMRDKER